MQPTVELTISDAEYEVLLDEELLNTAVYVPTGEPAAISRWVTSVDDQHGDVDLTDTYAAIAEVPPTPQRYGAIGNGVADDTSALTAWAAAGHSDGYIPPGVYLTSTGVVQPVSMNVTIADGATIRATSAMDTLWRISRTTQTLHKFLKGGYFDCNELALTGIELGSFAEFELSSVRIWDSAGTSLIVGHADAVSNPNSAWLNNISIRRASGLTNPSNSVGLHVVRATDTRVNNAFIQGADLAGVKVDVGSNRFANVHCWGLIGQLADYGIYDCADDNEWIACMADTPSIYGFYISEYRTRLIGCHSYMNGAYGSDNTATGLRFRVSAPDATVIGHYTEGGNVTHRWAQDMSGPSGFEWYVNLLANRTLHTVTTNIRPNSTLQTRIHALNTGGGLTVRGNTGASSAIMVMHDSGTKYFDINIVDGTTGTINILNGARVQAYPGNYGTETIRLDPATGAIQPGTSAGRGAAIHSGSGVPTLSATAGDIYIRTDGTVGSTLYQCAGTTTWAAIL
jgi:hypothetical protein